MIKLMRKIKIFMIQTSYNSLENSNLIDLFLKNSTFINTRVLFKNCKIYTRRN